MTRIGYSMFEPIDHLVAERVGAKSEEEKIALAYLSLITRLGHFCLFCGETVVPNPLLILGEDLSSIILKGFSTLKNYKGVVQEEGYWYFQRRYQEEKTIIEQYQRLLSSAPTIEADLREVVQKDTELLEEQKEAIIAAGHHAVTLITGGPGTGKSFTAAKLIHYLRLMHPQIRIAVAAPTGKAAANFSSNLGIKPKTIHRLLDYRLRQKEPTLLRTDLILIDESSMVDSTLFAQLLKSVASGTRLVLLGDPYQLPSVEGGAVFQDLLDWHKKQGSGLTCLRKCRRTQLASILELSTAVKEGDSQTVLKAVRPIDNLIEKLKIPHLSPQMPSEQLLEAFENRVILTPLRKGSFGAQALNKACRTLYGHSGCIPIMITRNDEELSLANGDVGVLIKKGDYIERGDYALFRTKAGIRKIPALLLPPFEDAYCLSVHKSQGSEYAEVIVVVPQGSERFGRELLYTAITRAKEKVEILGDLKSVERTVQNSYRRFSRITPFLPLKRY